MKNIVEFLIIEIALEATLAKDIKVFVVNIYK